MGLRFCPMWAAARVRRLRDLISLHLSDLGGEDAVRRMATLTVEFERMEAVFAEAGEAQPERLGLYQRTAGNRRRLLERRTRNVTPTPAEYLKSKNETT